MAEENEKVNMNPPPGGGGSGGSNFGDTSTFVDSPENDIGTSEQFIGNFLDSASDPCEVVKNRIFVTSDTHFRHKNILKYEAEFRPFENVEQMNVELINRWNSVVGPMDVVFHLGDFGFTSKNLTRILLSRMNGRKILLLGNHDREQKIKREKWIELGFSRVFSHPFMMDNRFIFSHEPLAEIPAGKINIYGHVHSSKDFKTFETNRYCVCVERHDLKPVEYAKIVELYGS